MNYLTNRQRVLVFLVGFFMGCVVLSFIHSNKRAAQEERKAGRNTDLPGIIQFYADLGAPLDGPFVLHESPPTGDPEGLQRRVLLIGSRDEIDLLRVEEWFRGEIGLSAVVENWRVTQADAVSIFIEDDIDASAVVRSINELGFRVLSQDRDTGAYLVETSRPIDSAYIGLVLEQLSALNGVVRADPVVIGASDNAPQFNDRK